MPTAITTILAAALALALAAGCKAKPAPDSGFLDDPQVMQKDEDVPFDRSWRASGFWAGDPRWKSIHIAPVNTDYVKAHPSWKGMWEKSPEKLEKDTQELAVFTRKTFEDAFRDDPTHRLEVVSEPRADSLILELALVEVVPNDAVLGVLGISPVGTMGASTVAKEVGKGSTAIEGRARTGSDRAVVAKFADREQGKFAPVNVRRATWYGESHREIREWADQCVKLLHAKPGEKVGDTKTFTLRPW